MGLRRCIKQIGSRVLVMRIALVLTVFCGKQAQVTAIAEVPAVISAQPYPVGDLRVTREELTSNSFRLAIENLNIAPAESNRARSQTWLLAGARGVLPKVEVESAQFIHLRNGLQTSSTATAPDQINQNLVRVADLGLYRQYWAYTLTVNTASPAGQDSFWVLQNATFIVDIGDAPATENKSGARWQPRFGESRMLSSTLLNPDISPAYYAVEYGDPVETWSDWTKLIAAPAATGDLYRFSVYSGGLYRLSADDVLVLTSATVQTAASTWRVYRGGLEVATIPGIRGDDAIYLPLPRMEADGLQEQVFWLDTSGKNVQRQPPLRVPSSGAVSSTADHAEVTSVSFSLVHRELVDYNPKLRSGAGSDRWVWTELEVDSPATLEIEMPGYFSPAPGSVVRTTVKYGFTNFPPVQPSLRFLIGNEEAAATTLTVQQGTAVMDLPAELIKPGKNPVALRLDYPFEAEAKRSATVQSIQTDWTQELDPPDDEAYFRASTAGSTITAALRFSGPLTGDAVVIGYQQETPTVLPHQQDSVSWKDQNFSDFYVGVRSAADRVPKLAKVETVPTFAQLASARSIIITAPELATATLALKPMHEDRGLSTQVYSTRTIYDAFSYGKPDPAAIRNFLRYLFYKAPGDAPEYVTLVGEASDFKGDPSLVPPTTQMDMIPASTAASSESPQGDQLYTAAIGSDLVGDFIVGRIPAATAAQVTGYVEKLKAFENAPHGDWSRVTEFVMDDNDEFPDVVGRIVAGGLAPPADTRLFRQWEFDYVPNLRVPGKKRSWEATDTLIDKFNEGIGVLNFFGHGGPNLWSHERLLHLSDLPQLTNALRLPLITCASCDNAWISYPTPPVKASMGEQMVLKPNGGALGLFGPVAGASPYEHSTLVQSLMEGVTRQQLRTVGDLIVYAENQYYAITRSASIPDQYLLLGDPTVTLPMPRVEPVLNAEVADTGEGSKSVRLNLITAADGASTGVLQLVSTERGEVMTSRIVSSGERSWDLTLPPNHPGGAVHALLDWSSENGRLAGTTFNIPPLHSLPQPKPELLDTEGDSYAITPLTSSENTAPVSGTFKFQIQSLTETTSSVRIEAVTENLVKVGEVPQLEVTTGTQLTTFDMQVTGPLDPPAAKVSLLVRLVESPSDAVITTHTFLLPIEGTPELEFVDDSARVFSSNESFLANKTVYLEATLRNSGALPARNITLQALRDSPSTGTELQTINDTTSYRLDLIDPGEEETVRFRWEEAQPGIYPNVYMTANRNKVVREGNFENNSILMPEFEVQALGNFAIESLEISPAIAVPGSTVTLSAVLFNKAPSNERPVTVELGWGRTLDGGTSSTRFPVKLEDGYATVTRDLMVPEAYTYAFAKVNADLEIEENNSGDNVLRSENIVVTKLPKAKQGEIALGSTLISGTAYNLDMPFKNQLRVSPQFTSATDHLIVDHQNITNGSATASDTPDDNAWWVVPWRIAVSPGEAAGEIGFRLPLSTVHTDVPGILRGYFLSHGGTAPVVEIAAGDEPWKRITATPSANKFLATLGRIITEDGALKWRMRAVEGSGIILESMLFYPLAVQWDSPPYLIPRELRSTLLTFTVDTDDKASWQSFHIEWRSGRSLPSGELYWTPWQSVEGWSAPLSADEYLQIRILGVPLSDEKPFLENFRLTHQ